jgi:hypothetical protein
MMRFAPFSLFGGSHVFTNRPSMLLLGFAGLTLAAVVLWLPEARAQATTSLEGLQAALDDLRAGIRPPSNNQTRLLFQFVTNQAGFDTGMTIANTAADPFGTPGKTGACAIRFYGAGTPPPFTTPRIAPGQTYTNILSQIAGGFQGYAIAVCDFPLAHGSAFLGDIGFARLAWNTPVLVLPSTRSAARVESLGQ